MPGPNHTRFTDWIRRCVELAGRVLPQPARRRWVQEWDAEFRAFANGPVRKITTRGVVMVIDALRYRFELRQRDLHTSPSSERRRRPMRHAELLEDLRYGLRALRRAPGFAIVAVATMALGIGTTTTVFSVVNGIIWRPMPYPEADRVMAVWPGRSFEPREIVRLREQVTAFSAIAGHVTSGGIIELGAVASYGFGPLGSAELFEVLGTPAYLGRTWVSGEDQPGEIDRVVVSFDFWLRELGSDSSVIGRRIQVERNAHTIIGVMPKHFDFLQPNTSLARPLVLHASSPNFTGNWVNVFGRLAPGVSPEEAQQELTAIFTRWQREYGYAPGFGQGVTVVPVQESLTATVRRTMYLLLGAVALTLFVATSNLAGLLLNRAMTRERELAVRRALGATPSRILRQLMTESTVITMLGGAIGLLVSVWGIRGMVAILPASTPRLEYVTLDARVMLISAALVLGSGWIAGLVPGIQAWREGGRGLHEGHRGASEDRRRRMTRSGLVVTELALSVVLLVGAGMLIRSLNAIHQVDPGIEVNRLLVYGLSPTSEINTGPEALDAYYQRIQASVARVPGVAAVAQIHVLPIGGGGWNAGITVEGRAPIPNAPYVGVWWRPVSNNYIEAAGMQVLAGRGFMDTDARLTAPVAIVNESLVRQFFPDEAAVGQRIQHGLEGDAWITIVGVVRNVTHLGLTNATPPTMYRPFEQSSSRLSALNITSRWMVLRTSLPPEQVLEPVRAAAIAATPDVPIVRLEPMADVVRRSLADPRALAILLTIFAVSAVSLGAVGLFGLVSYTVKQRTREIGIRLALGARGQQITALVLRQGLNYAFLGLAIGLTASWFAVRAARQVLFEIAPVDPVTYVWVTGVLLCTVVLASLGPGLAAGRSDPITTLRSD